MLDRDELEKLKESWKKLPFFNEEEFNRGLELARISTKHWNKQTDPGRVFIMGRRVHHGSAGLALSAVAILTQDSQLLGYAYGLMDDDIDDSDEWLNFDEGGDPDSFFSMA